MDSGRLLPQRGGGMRRAATRIGLSTIVAGAELFHCEEITGDCTSDTFVANSRIQERSLAVRKLNRLHIVLGIAVAAVLTAGHSLDANRIDAVRGRRYMLTKQHGPWMIHVATFREPPPEARTEGMTPQQAADELVYELRTKGIPAYTFSQGKMYDELAPADPTRRQEEGRYQAHRKSISVLAGNYKDVSSDSKQGRVAQATLEFVKKFHPKFLRRVQQSNGFLNKLSNGGIYRVTPGRPKPLSGAFLTINPLLSPEEARQKKRSPLLLKLNSGMEYSLLENPGNYTLVVASFHGKSTIQLANGEDDKSDNPFKVTNSLDEAAYSAWELANTLRKHEKQFEAYVWHDKYSSVVTVGAFQSPNDPRIKELQEIFRAKRKPHPQTGQQVLLAESLTIPANPPPGTVPDKRWMFDPTPRLIEVPKL